MRYAIVVMFVVLLAVSHPVQPSIAGTMLPVPVSAASDVAADADNSDAELARIRAHIQALLSKPQPEIFARHLRSMLALCEEDVLKLEFAGANQNDQAKELSGYLKVIEAGFNDDGGRSETYLVDGKRALTLARLSRSDGTLQFYTVSLPPHWDPDKAYPPYVQFHGRGPDIPLAYVQYTFLPHDKDEKRNDEVIAVVPWLRGNGEWREENGSEPDIWEAIDDVKSFAKLDADRWYISGHSWGETMCGRLSSGLTTSGPLRG